MSQLPDKMGYEISETLGRSYPQMRILVLSGIDSDYFIQTMIRQGCRGYLLKGNTDSAMLTSAIRAVHEGELFIDPSVKEQLLANMLHSRRKATQTFARLTEREKEVLQLVIEEYRNTEIAERLNISLRTVENHKYNLQQKLNAKNTVGLVKAALHMGILK
jgi:DNA-binding NarL/FixJ family response regulator